MTVKRSAKVIKIRRDGQYISMVPAVEDVLSAFVTTRHIPQTDRGGVLRVPYPLLWDQEFRLGKQGLQTFAGLEPHITEWLQCHGYRVVTAGPRPQPLATPKRHRLIERIPVIDHHLLDFVRQQERGLFVLGPTVAPAQLVAQIATAWRQERIMVLVTRRSEAVEIRRQLQNLLPRGATAVGHKSTKFTRRVVVTTPGYARLGIHQIEQRTMLICLNPEDCFRSGELASPVDVLRQAGRARLYGIQKIGQRQSPYIDGFIHALFGDRQVVIPSHGKTERPVEVGFWTMKGGPNLTRYNSLRLLRKGVWQHPIRNRLCATIARRIQQCAWAEFEKQFPSLLTLNLKADVGTVVLLAANLEQALALAQELPCASIAYERNSCRDGLSDQQRTRLSNPVNSDSNIVIATPLGVLQLSNIGVLIRADGGCNLPTLSDCEWEIDLKSTNRLVVIDCVDRHHQSLRCASQARKVAYKEAGWNIVEVENPVPTLPNTAQPSEVKQ